MFTAPGWLLLGALAGLILTFHARRRRRIEVASVRIWRLLEQPSLTRRTFSWPPPNLLLFLQLLVVLLVALALAQPFLGTDPGRPDHVVYVLDTSGSMRTRDGDGERADAAIANLQRRIAALSDADRVSVVTAGPVSELWVARQTEPSGILPILANIRSGDGTADWAEAAEWIATVVRAGETTRLVVLTDGTDAGYAALALAVPGIEVVPALFGGPAANAAIDVTVEPAEDGTWAVRGIVSYPADAAAPEVTARFAPDGTLDFLDWGAIPLADGDSVDAGGGRVERPFEAELTLPGSGTLIVRIPDDDGAHDNAVRLLLRDEPRSVRVLLLGSPGPEIVRALQAVRNVELLEADALPANDAAFDLVVVSDVALERRPNTNVLWLARAGLAGDPEPPLVGDASLTGWNAEHPLSAGVDWARFATARAYDVPRLPGATVLVEAAGSPLVQARTTGAGREIRLAADLTRSDWTLDPAFPVFVQNVVEWLGITPGAGIVPPCSVGSPCSIEARHIADRIVAEDGAVVRPASRSADWLLPGAEDSFVPQRAGLYRIEGDGETVLVAVNAPGLAESAVVRAEDAPGSPAVNPAPSLPPLWWWLLLGALAVLIVETWIAGRGPDRFLYRTSLSRAMPHADRRRAILAVRAIGIVFLAAAILQVPRPGFGPTEAVVAVFGTDLDFDQAVTARLPESVAAAAAAAKNSIGWVASGAVATVARDLDQDLPVERPETSNPPGADLQRATLLAAAMLPGDRPGRVVAVADGNETSGRLADATAQLQARGVPVDALPLSALPAGEVVVEWVGMPASVREGDLIPLEAIVLSAVDATALVSIFRDGALVTEQEIRLRPGRNRVEASVAAGEAGNALFEVAVSAADDVFEANNRNGAIATVRAAPSVLVIAADTGWGEYFADALAVQSLAATVIGPEDAPWYIYDWLKYDLVVLMNVPAIDLDTRQQALLEDFVEVHGGGLLILGGEHAFGPGGYYQTALERISPLSSRIPHDAPRAAMAFVLDRSGSMQAMVDGASRLEIAKVATLSAVDLLHEESQVAVVVFDSEARVLVPLQERKDQAAVAAALGPIVSAGGTALLPALTAGFEELRKADADARHIVIMTDGLVEAADFGPLLADIRAEGITVSAVAMGDAAEVRRAETIARLGGGAFHATRDFNALPSILSQEALQMSGDPIKEGTTPVFWSDRSAAFLAGLPDELPALENFVTTTAQPGATVHLALSDEADETIPVLASWRYGAGRVVAFASHGAGSGTQNWMRIPEYPLLWAQTIRHLVPDVEGPGLHATIERKGDEAFLTADLLDRDGAPIAGDTVTVASVETPDQTRALIETAPGRYELALGAIGSGTHRFTVASPAAETEAVLHAAYPARLDFGRADPDRLTALAAATGGAVLAADAPFLEVSRGWLMKAEWRLWALIALALFLVDLAIRYTPDLLRIGWRASGPNTR